MPDPAATHWVHNLDPFLLHISGDFGIRWYGLSYLVGILGGWWLLARWAKAGRLPMQPQHVGDFIMTIAIGMVAGGRLGYAAIYEPSLFWTFSGHVPFWKLLAVHEGGMASHGGIAGVGLAAWWWSWRRGQDLLVLGDALATVGPFGIACGRAANFINGELWGRPWDGPWAVIFPGADPPVPRHPSQLYAMFLEGLLILAILPLSLDFALVLLPAVGLMLNGTSSVLYGTVPEFVSPEKRTHAFAVFYTGGSVASAIGPLLLGLLGDVIGLSTALVAVSCVALTTVPMVWALRPAFRS